MGGLQLGQGGFGSATLQRLLDFFRLGPYFFLEALYPPRSLLRLSWRVGHFIAFPSGDTGARSCLRPRPVFFAFSPFDPPFPGCQTRMGHRNRNFPKWRLVPTGRATSSPPSSPVGSPFALRPAAPSVAFRQIKKQTGNRLRQQLVDGLLLDDWCEPLGGRHGAHGRFDRMDSQTPLDVYVKHLPELPPTSTLAACCRCYGGSKPRALRASARSQSR